MQLIWWERLTGRDLTWRRSVSLKVDKMNVAGVARLLTEYWRHRNMSTYTPGTLVLSLRPPTDTLLRFQPFCARKITKKSILIGVRSKVASGMLSVNSHPAMEFSYWYILSGGDLFGRDYTPCLKIRSNLFFCSVSVTHEPISICISWSKHLAKLL